MYYAEVNEILKLNMLKNMLFSLKMKFILKNVLMQMQRTRCLSLHI